MVKLDHLTLPVRDYRVARDWYVNHLDLGAGASTEFDIPERLVAALQDSDGFTLFPEQSSADTHGPACVLYFQVDSVDETFGRLLQRGVRFTLAPAKHFWGYGAELADPDGNRVRLWDAVSMKANGD